MATIQTRLVVLRRPNARSGEVEQFRIATHCDACAIEIAQHYAGPEGADAWFSDEDIEFTALGEIKDHVEGPGRAVIETKVKP